jgi:predicted 3-demethylubiquinone-9 3-methyltransferase (glyoxalase superfamily)
MLTIQKISSFLWFDDKAEEAVAFYLHVFKNSKITTISRYDESWQDIHRKPLGSAMTIAFELAGQSFVAFNGGPILKMNQAVSFVINCETQDEIDSYWEKLSEGGDAKTQQCGWITDKFGVTWQVVPAMLPALLKGPDPAKSGRVMRAILQMKKLKIDELKQAYDG